MERLNDQNTAPFLNIRLVTLPLCTFLTSLFLKFKSQVEMNWVLYMLSTQFLSQTMKIHQKQSCLTTILTEKRLFVSFLFENIKNDYISRKEVIV